MKKYILLMTFFCSVNAAAVEVANNWLTKGNIHVGQIISAKVVNSSQSSYADVRNYLNFAELELTIEIKGSSCSFRKDSYLINAFERETDRDLKIDFYTTTAYLGSACAGMQSTTVRVAKVTLPLVNGFTTSDEVRSSKVYIYDFPAEENTRQTYKVLVNQAQNKIVLDVN